MTKIIKHAFPESYNLVIHSFTDDFYFAALVVQSFNNKKQFVGNCTISFDSELESFVFSRCAENLEQVMLDFECEKLDELEKAILALIIDKETLIFNEVKTLGNILNLVILD